MRSSGPSSGTRAAFLLAIGCLSVGAGPAAGQQYPEEKVARIDVSQDEITVGVGERVPVRFTPLDAEGNVVEDVVMGVSSRGSAAWYDPVAGAVLGVMPGDELVAARIRRALPNGPGFDDLFGFVRVTVIPGPVDRVEVEPAELTLYAGSRQIVSATAWSGDLARDDAVVSWMSSDPGTVTITPGGLATGISVGSARLTATVEGSSSSVAVRVLENPIRSLRIEPPSRSARVGDVVRFRVAALDASGREVPGARAEWLLVPSGAGPSLDAYLDADGAFVAYEAGLHRVQAGVGSVTAIAEIEAVPRAPRSRVHRIAHGVPPRGQSLTDLWVFEGRDGRDYTYLGTYSGNLMYVWDVTDPAHPVITDSLEFDGRRVNDVKVDRDATVAIVTSENASNRLNGITVLDIADPAHPVRKSHFTDGLTGGVHNTWIEGNLVYAVHYGTMDLHVIDISDREHPKRVGRWSLEKPNRWLHDVMVKDGLAYLSYWDDGVVILDVGAGIAGGTPTTPRFVSQYSYNYRLGNDREHYGNTHHTIRYGNYVFAGDEIFGCAECINGPRGYIHVLDVSDIRNPREVAFYRVPEAGSHNMWAEDDKLYIGYYQAGLRVVDISGELRGDLYRQGREIAWFMTEDAEGSTPNVTDTWGAQPYKGVVFAADFESGLWIVRLEPPESEPLN